MKNPKGFTLVELLIAMALISAVSITLFYFALSSVRLISRAAALSRSDQTARFVAGRISYDIAQSGGALPGSGPAKLVLGGIYYEYRDNKVRREEGSDVYYLTTEGEIKGLKFSYPLTKLIKVEITPKLGGVYYFNVYARN
ncbi:MAG: prepilin-type N-terminal cleavage/methylation domain-containing protein [bacterium]